MNVANLSILLYKHFCYSPSKKYSKIILHTFEMNRNLKFIINTNNQKYLSIIYL